LYRRIPLEFYDCCGLCSKQMDGLSTFLILVLMWSSSVVAYRPGDRIPLYVNKVGPYYNPFETYDYYSMPFCQPIEKTNKALTLSEILDGDRLTESQYDIRFLKEIPTSVICEKTFLPQDIDLLRRAVEQLYYYEFVLDGILIRGFLGHMKVNQNAADGKGRSAFIWKHLHFVIEYNDEDVIMASVDTAKSQLFNLDDIKHGVPIRFTYDVTWKKSDVTYNNRMHRIEQVRFFPVAYEIRWNAVRNSLVIILIVMLFILVLIRRVLSRDFARYNREEFGLGGEDGSSVDDGWKLVHGDVFRPPERLSFFCAVVGLGAQFLFMGSVLTLLLSWSIQPERHAIFSASFIFAYFFTQCVAGLVSTKLYCQLEGKFWVKNANLTSILFSCPLFFVWSFINTIAWIHGSTLALPWTTIFLLLFLWSVLSYPLSILGSVVGKSMASSINAPCRTRNIRREIPYVPWYKSMHAQAVLAGFLQFSAMSFELYYLFAAVWVRHNPDVYLIMASTLLKVFTSCSCISVVFTYMQLMAEDYRWWWRNIYAALSTSVFIYAYAVYFFFVRTNMYGFLQITQFLGCALLLAFVFFLVFSAIAFFASFYFVKYIYRNIKID
jgi:transmembrane 9 superfamily member 1